jgi:hypothetical protein
MLHEDAMCDVRGGRAIAGAELVIIERPARAPWPEINSRIASLILRVEAARARLHMIRCDSTR